MVRRRVRPAPGRSGRVPRGAIELKAFVVAFVLLLTGAVSVAVAQFKTVKGAAWVSLGCSVAAIIAVAVSLRVRPKP